MLKYIHGNLLDTPNKIIFHGCNAQGVMGSGVAAAVRAKWPECYRKYNAYYNDFGLQLNDVVWYHGDTKSVANCITQQNYGPGLQVDYKAVRASIRKVLDFASKNKIAVVAGPRIGAGLAGGDWKIISAILEKESERANVDINCYILDPKEYSEATGLAPVGTKEEELCGC